MPRPKKNETSAELKRQMDDLAAKLGEAKRREAETARAERRRKAELAGNILLKAIEENPDSPLAVAFRAVADMGVAKAADRELLGLSESAKAPAKKAAST